MEATDVAADLEHRWERIAGEMLAHRDTLARQGSICEKVIRGRVSYRVRFVVRGDSRQVHRTIAIGRDKQLAERADELLQAFRRHAATAEEADAAAYLIGRLATGIKGRR